MKDGPGRPPMPGSRLVKKPELSFSSLPSLSIALVHDRGASAPSAPPTVSGCFIVSAAGRISSVRILHRRFGRRDVVIARSRAGCRLNVSTAAA